MASKVYECISKIADSIIENKDYLTELDREIGDADHGINMARGYTEALGQLPQDEADIGTVLKKTGMVLLSKVGGASGPLYGTAYMKAAKAAAGKSELTSAASSCAVKPSEARKLCWMRSSLPMKHIALQWTRERVWQTASTPCAQLQRKGQNLPRLSAPQKAAPAIWATAASVIRIPAPPLLC